MPIWLLPASRFRLLTTTAAQGEAVSWYKKTCFLAGFRQVGPLCEPRTQRFVIVCFAMIIGCVITAQRLTIPEAVERIKPQLCRETPCAPYVTSRVRELAPWPFDRAVHDSDLIVHGSVKKIGTYLSSNKTELYTDYELTVITAIAQRQSEARKARGPAPVLVRQWGGETTISGITVRVTDENIPLLPTDTPLLLLLSYDRSLGKYKIFDEVAGAFIVDRGALRHMAIPAVASYGRFNGMALNNAIHEVHQLGR
jgi:hypothetical protein